MNETKRFDAVRKYMQQRRERQLATAADRDLIRERERAAKLVETVELTSHSVMTREQVVELLTRLAEQIRSGENAD